MIRLSLISTSLGFCCDVLFVRATDLVLQLPDGPVSDEGVDVPLVRSSFAAPLDAEPQEVEPVGHVHHLRLRLGETKTERLQHVGDVLAQRLDVVVCAVDQNHEIVRVADDSPVGRHPSGTFAGSQLVVAAGEAPSARSHRRSQRTRP